MSFRRPAICRIAIVLLASVALPFVAPASSRGENVFYDDAIPPGIDHSASRAAREELARARLILTRARAASFHAVRGAAAEGRQSAGFRSLQSEAMRAISAYRQAQRPALKALFYDTEYAALAKERDAARAQIRAATITGRVDFQQLFPLANKALAAGERMTRAESIVIAVDPDVEDARIAMTDAFAVLRRASMSVRERIENSPALAVAAEDVASARQRVADANANLAAALKAEAAADRTRRRARNS